MHWVLPANGKDFENEFLQKKNIIWDQWHFAYSTKSFWFCTANYVVFKLKQAYSQPATNCGLIEGNLFTNIVRSSDVVTNSCGESWDSSCEKSWVPVQNHWVPVQKTMSPKLKMLWPLCNQTDNLKMESISAALLVQGLEGYFRDSGFDQNTVRESGKR